MSNCDLLVSKYLSSKFLLINHLFIASTLDQYEKPEIESARETHRV